MAQSSPIPPSDLSKQASPYLRAHANDAVKWQTFDIASFEMAKQQDKPILLSSGYLSCYWCHRMAEDSFRKPSVGSTINKQFIPILLDRELEPETDAYLQEFMTQQRGFGGWPLTVILTPDAKPVAGFSYQSEEATLKTLKGFETYWSTQRSAVESSAQGKAKRLDSSFSSQASSSQKNTSPLNIQRLLNNFLQQSQRIADNDFGGFGQTEKFPFVPQLTTLLNLDHLHSPAQYNVQLREFLQTTLQAMLGSGLRDHVGGGFFRYSDTREWSAPHFEQMLHTQALLAPLLLQAGKQWKKPAYTEASRAVLLGMIKYFQRADGLFRAALSAVSVDGIAGGYYLWTETELRKLLGKQYSAIYPLPLGGQSQYLPLIMVSGESRLKIRQRLLNARERRQLKTDDKALLGWNGLALSALARGAELSPAIRSAGERLFKQLERLLATKKLPRLIDAPEAGLAQLTDQVFLVQGLYDWANATKNEALLDKMPDMLITLFKRYYDEGNWQAATDKPLIGQLRSSALVDNELPSPTGIWLKLASQLLTDTDNTATKADQTKLAELQEAVDVVSQQLPDTLEDHAFFHGTTLTALLKLTFKKKP